MKTFSDSLRLFYNGKNYPLTVALLVLLGHALGAEVLFGALLLALIVPACLVCHDFRFGIAPFLYVIFIVSAKGYSPNDTGYADRFLNPASITGLVAIVVILLAALIYFALRNRKIVNQIPRGGMLLSLGILCGAFLLNGLFNPKYDFKNLLYVIIFSATLLVVYLLFALYFRFDRDSTDYLMYCLVVAGLLIAAELLLGFFTHIEINESGIVKETVVLGWGVWTNIGGMLAFLMPSCFYFAATSRRGLIGYLLGFFFLFCILLSQSRGALLVGGVVLLICLVALCVKGDYRKRNRVLTAIVALCGVAVCVLFMDQILAIVNNFLEYGFADNGRFEKWQAGWNHFLDYPVFGSGFYDSYIDEAWDMPLYPYLYHNTVIQVLGATGIVGTLAYAYHRFCTLRAVFRLPNTEKTYLGICILALLLFSLTDVLLFKTYPTIYYSLMLLFMDKSQAENMIPMVE